MKIDVTEMGEEAQKIQTMKQRDDGWMYPPAVRQQLHRAHFLFSVWSGCELHPISAWHTDHLELTQFMTT